MASAVLPQSKKPRLVDDEDHINKSGGGWSKGNSMKGLCSPNITIVPCNREDCRSNEKRFKSNLTVYNQDTIYRMESIGKEVALLPDSIVLDALVLDNNIAVLVMPFPINESIIVNVSYHPDFEVDITEISGKFKKGSKNVTALDTIAHITVSDTAGDRKTIGLQAPIAGKMVESNDLLSCYPKLIASRHRSDGYLAVFTSDAPSILARSGSYIDLLPIDAGEANVVNGKTCGGISKRKEKVCFSWIKGSCSRGESCKFKHVEKVPEK